jgi:hypothetical protein
VDPEEIKYYWRSHVWHVTKNHIRPDIFLKNKFLQIVGEFLSCEASVSVQCVWKVLWSLGWRCSELQQLECIAHWTRTGSTGLTDQPTIILPSLSFMTVSETPNSSVFKSAGSTHWCQLVVANCWVWEPTWEILKMLWVHSYWALLMLHAPMHVKIE